MAKFSDLFLTEEKQAENIEPVQPTIEAKPNKEPGCEDVDVFNFVNINQNFGNFKLFENFSLDIKDFSNRGQFISFIGKSGCGKTSLLKYLAGLSKPQDGKILYYGKELTEKDRFPMIFQHYSSFEWMTVLENVALPMKMKGVDKKTREEHAMKLLELVGLKGHEHKWAKTPPLSGGQLQRVALARCLATDSNIILLDEYSSGLDIFSKHSIQDTLLDVYYNSEQDPTFINVSHDISECVYLSNRIYVFTANPCQIHTVIDIDFDVERRDSSIRNTKRYAEYVSLIEKIMNDVNS